MHMPERDIEVYAEMREMTARLMAFSERLEQFLLIENETRKVLRQAIVGREVNEKDVALVISDVTRRLGGGQGLTGENLFADLSDMAGRVIRLGDRLGNFMRVDDETHRIIRMTRLLAVDMRGIMGMSMADARLSSDEEELKGDLRKILKGSRILAVDLQGEIERRVGTS